MEGQLSLRLDEELVQLRRKSDIIDLHHLGHGRLRILLDHRHSGDPHEMDLGVHRASSGGGQLHVAGDVHLDVFDHGLPGLAGDGDELCLQLYLREVGAEYLGFSQMFL